MGRPWAAAGAIAPLVPAGGDGKRGRRPPLARTGGSAWQLTWAAESLAQAGFLVAAVDHHGNNAVDGYLPEGFAFWWERALDLSFVLDLLSAERSIATAGALGFSLGGIHGGRARGREDRRGGVRAAARREHGPRPAAGVPGAGADRICPDARRYADLVPAAEGRCVGESVDHYAFLQSTEGAEPVREVVAAEAVDFFRRRLQPQGEPVT